MKSNNKNVDDGLNEYIERKRRERDRRNKRRSSKNKKREWLYTK